ncbi:MAG: sucrose phosphorylase [Gemmatimonadaceae bacterium]
MALRNQVQLIAYPHRMGGNLAGLADVLESHLSRAVGGVHILPFYPSNADSGFSPLTHKEVDPNFGTWADIERIAAKFDICADLTINHISDESVEFRDFVANGMRSEYADLFVHVDQLGEISPDDLAKIHIRKEKEPFREVRLPDGTVHRVWTTFTEKQIDLNYNSPRTYALMEEYVTFLAARGVKLFRLDAFGYTTKRIGTSCFLVEPDVYEILRWIHRAAVAHGADTLPEVHDHPSYQHAISLHGMRPYGFALPPLVLHALLDADSTYLKRWLRMCPRNQVSVLDTHDGICIPDVEGLLPQQEIQDVIDNVSQRSADPIYRRSAASVHSVGAIYQLTCTFYDALKQNDDANVAARAIQLFSPGIPQVYYVGWLGGTNEIEQAEQSGDPRDVNRHFYTREAIDAAVRQPMVRRIQKLMEFRSTYPAFNGEFQLEYSNNSSVAVAWRLGDYRCELFVDLIFKKATIRYADPHTGRTLTIKC